MNYRTVYRRPPPRRRSHRLRNAVVAVILIAVLCGGYASYAVRRPLPVLFPTTASLNLRTQTGGSQLTWPTTGQSAVAVEKTDILLSHSQQTAVPIASVAKVITALTVLQKKPITAGQPGPTLTLTEADAALYNQYVAQGGSVVPVAVGEQITEYQALETLMLPSANNLADSLAVWAFGSLQAYQSAASQYITKLGMHDTKIGSDASGFSPTTVSTAHDLAILGKQAMDNSVLRHIVSQATSTDVPLTDSISNVNFLLGSNNIIGIKTGNTDQAGGVYLSASTTVIDSQTMTIITALVGAPTLYRALMDSLPLITSAQANFVSARLLAAHAGVGEYALPWGGVLPAVTRTALTSPAWRGSSVTTHVTMQPITMDARAGQIVGMASSPKSSLAPANKTDVILQNAPTQPSIWWRLIHPF